MSLDKAAKAICRQAFGRDGCRCTHDNQPACQAMEAAALEVMGQALGPANLSGLQGVMEGTHAIYKKRGKKNA